MPRWGFVNIVSAAQGCAAVFSAECSFFNSLSMSCCLAGLHSYKTDRSNAPTAVGCSGPCKSAPRDSVRPHHWYPSPLPSAFSPSSPPPLSYTAPPLPPPSSPWPCSYAASCPCAPPSASPDPLAAWALASCTRTCVSTARASRLCAGAGLTRGRLRAASVLGGAQHLARRGSLPIRLE